MGCISVPAALIASAAIGAGTSAYGASQQSSAAGSAAHTQYSADIQALEQQMQMFQQIQGYLSPYRNLGQTGMNSLLSALGQGPGGQGFLNSYLGKPLPNPMTTAGSVPKFSWNPTMAGLAATPGYQFALNQGELAVQNQNAAMGLGESGAQTKGAENYAEGLASTTYNSQLANALSIYGAELGGQQQGFTEALNSNQLTLNTRQQLYDMLSGEVGTGLNAAAGTGQFGQAATNAATGYLTSGASALAGGIMGSANALSQGAFGIGNSLSSGLSSYSLFSYLSSLNNGGNLFTDIGNANPGYWSDFGNVGGGGLNFATGGGG